MHLYNELTYMRYDGAGGVSAHIDNLKAVFDALAAAGTEFAIAPGQQRTKSLKEWDRSRRRMRLGILEGVEAEEDIILLVGEEHLSKNKMQIKVIILVEVEAMNVAVVEAAKGHPLGAKCVHGGLSMHVVRSPELLRGCIKGVGTVQLGSSSEISISKVHVGSLELAMGNQEVLKMPESLVVPELRRNLLSVAKLADAGVITMFDKGKVSF
ncbi:hypothetical protein R1flu_026936 [Riccia fluitans]|uniref:Uncharacterized protein n=1 Tax=Riccia fluitans TaxID=41844 RepID=A0ABD1XHC0_9MARC